MNHSGRPERAYALRSEKKLPWKEVARILGYSNNHTASTAAKVWAYRNDKPWPIGDSKRRKAQNPGTAWQVGSHGEIAYTIRRDTRADWTSIARRVGNTSPSGAYSVAFKYARTRDLPWPLPATEDILEEAMAYAWGRAAYELRPFLTWVDIGIRLNVSPHRLRDYMANFMEVNDLGPPDELPPIGLRSYNLRTTGLPWGKVAIAVGKTHAAHACEVAGEHARAHGLEWPIRLPRKKAA